MIKSPVLIIGCARSGTTLLYQVLSEVPELWSIGYESKAIIERFHSPAQKGWVSGELDAADLTSDSRAYMLAQFVAQAAPGAFWRAVNTVRRELRSFRPYTKLKGRGRQSGFGSGQAASMPQLGLNLARGVAGLYRRVNPVQEPIRLLEKTPENCLRLPFLQALFPDARIVFLTRDGRANVHSLMEGWRQPHLFPGYAVPEPVRIEGITRQRWAFTLIPGWQGLLSASLEEVCARQWTACNEAVLTYAQLPGALPLMTVRYEDLTGNPTDTLVRLASFLELEVEGIPAYQSGLPVVNVVSSPDEDKWRTAAVESVLPLLEPTMRKLGYTVE